MTNAETEHQHRPVQGASARLQHGVLLGEHEHEGHVDRAERNGRRHAQKLAQHEERPRDRLGDHGEGGAVLDLAAEHVGRDERRQQAAADEHRRQPMSMSMRLVVLHREGRQRIGQDDGDGRDHQHHQHDGLADALEERVAEDREGLLEHAEVGIRTISRMRSSRVGEQPDQVTQCRAELWLRAWPQSSQVVSDNRREAVVSGQPVRNCAKNGRTGSGPWYVVSPFCVRRASAGGERIPAIPIVLPSQSAGR